jgi:hypothetical protein
VARICTVEFVQEVESEIESVWFTYQDSRLTEGRNLRTERILGEQLTGPENRHGIKYDMLFAPLDIEPISNDNSYSD